MGNEYFYASPVSLTLIVRHYTHPWLVRNGSFGARKYNLGLDYGSTGFNFIAIIFYNISHYFMALAHNMYISLLMA